MSSMRSAARSGSGTAARWSSICGPRPAFQAASKRSHSASTRRLRVFCRSALSWGRESLMRPGPHLLVGAEVVDSLIILHLFPDLANHAQLALDRPRHAAEAHSDFLDSVSLHFPQRDRAQHIVAQE